MSGRAGRSGDVMAPAPGAASYAMVAALVLIWGSTFLLVKLALVEARPELVATARIGFAMLVIVPVAVLSGRGLPQGRARWLGCAAVGIFSLAIPFSLLAWAQQVVPSGVAGIYMAVIPLMVLPLAHLFSPGERMTRWKVIGFIIGFCGVLVLIGLDALLQLGSADGLAQLACLGSALSYATGSILIRRMPKTDPVVISAAALLIASALVLPFGLAAWPTEPISAPVLGIMVVTGAVSTALAMILRVAVITRAGSVFMSSAGYLVPITALFLGAVFADEKVEPADITACIIILAGLAIAQRKPRAVR